MPYDADPCYNREFWVGYIQRTCVTCSYIHPAKEMPGSLSNGEEPFSNIQVSALPCPTCLSQALPVYNVVSDKQIERQHKTKENHVHAMLIMYV